MLRSDGDVSGAVEAVIEIKRLEADIEDASLLRATLKYVCQDITYYLRTGIKSNAIVDALKSASCCRY